MTRSFAAVLCVFIIVGWLLGGCASTRATKKDLSVLMPGVARAAVIDELGPPASTTTSRTGGQVDVFTFVQGTRESKKPPRPVEPEQAEAAQVMVLLGQLPHSPLNLLSGKKISVQVNYDEEACVRDVVLLRLED
jgi:hypothetical protein